jgi:hypothetical protein
MRALATGLLFGVGAALGLLGACEIIAFRWSR